MSEIKADMGRNDTLARSSLNTAPPANAKVQNKENMGDVVSKGGNNLPVEDVTKVNETDAQAVENAVSQLNSYVQSTARTLNFQVDDESGKTVIKVYDRESEQLIRQIPNELVLELARRLNEEEPSLLFEAQV